MYFKSLLRPSVFFFICQHLAFALASLAGTASRTKNVRTQDNVPEDQQITHGLQVQLGFPQPEDWLTGAPQVQLRIKNVITIQQRGNLGPPT